MEILRVKGSHKECGVQVGQKFGGLIQKAITETKNYPAPGFDWEGTLAYTGKYYDNTRKAYPLLAEEIEGVAVGAGVDPIELFTYMVEELWGAPLQEARACSDIILTPPLTDGRIIVGHNNDVSQQIGRLMFPVEWNFDDGMSVFIVGPLGFYVSAGANSHGVVLTGNEVTQTDAKIGIPRSIIARAILTAKNIDEAVNIATDVRRASSYNNIISTRDRVVDVEGSGTRFEATEPENGYLAHTNHYVCPSMLSFEGKPNYTSSIMRLDQARKMVETSKGGFLTEKDMEGMLSSHNDGRGDDNTICRHGEKSETVFGMTVDFSDGTVRLAMGNPCKNKFEEVWKITS